MNCPTDGSTLVMSERNGVEIDYCPQCRGVWLDRGELDKIVDRVVSDFPAAPRQAPQSAPSAAPQYGQQPYYGKKRSHWLTELFD